MKKIIYKNAFTLAELLIALAVVGVVAILSIPSMVEDYNKKILTNQLKNDYAIVQQLIENSLNPDPTNPKAAARYIQDTELSTVSGFLGKLSSTKQCSSGTTSPCWASEYGTIGHPETKDINTPEVDAVLMKNGGTVGYEIIDEDGPQACYGTVWIDVNGVDKPNILGRDLFKFFVTKLGKTVDSETCSELQGIEPEVSEEDVSTLAQKLKTNCASGTSASACLRYIQVNSWKMDY